MWLLRVLYEAEWRTTQINPKTTTHNQDDTKKKAAHPCYEHNIPHQLYLPQECMADGWRKGNWKIKEIFLNLFAVLLYGISPHIFAFVLAHGIHVEPNESFQEQSKVD